MSDPSVFSIALLPLNFSFSLSAWCDFECRFAPLSNRHALVYLLLLECFSRIHITVILTLPRVWVKHSKKTQETKAHEGRTLLSQKQAVAWLSRPAPSR